MLYERWRKTAGKWRDRLALNDTATGRQWTFAELFAAGDSRATGAEHAVFPQGHSPDFILDLLAAWRERKIACPVEPRQDHQPPLPLHLLNNLPPAIVHLKTTSATGGTAKLVAFTAEQLSADAENIVATMGLRADWPNLGVISMAHSYGFSNLVLPLLLHGIPLILAPTPLPETVRLAAKPEAAVTIAGVPAMWRAWHEAGAIPPNARLAISAGAPLALDLEKSIFERTGVKIHNFLGSTECGGMAYDGSDSPRADAACAGAPMRNVTLSLNPEGCLTVHSRAVAETYWPEKSASLGNGVFQTGDLAELKDGLVFLRGRVGDLINVAGRKISPEVIECALLANPGVRECLVFGMPSPDAERTEIIVAVVAADAAETELKQFLLDKIPAWQVPRKWHFVDSLATNPRGKISRVDWRKQLGQLLSGR